MPRNLKRYYGRGDFHFITFSCYRRQAPPVDVCLDRAIVIPGRGRPGYTPASGVLLFANLKPAGPPSYDGG